jgi:hypothetical protein
MGAAKNHTDYTFLTQLRLEAYTKCRVLVLSLIPRGKPAQRLISGAPSTLVDLDRAPTPSIAHAPSGSSDRTHDALYLEATEVPNYQSNRLFLQIDPAPSGGISAI